MIVLWFTHPVDGAMAIVLPQQSFDLRVMPSFVLSYVVNGFCVVTIRR